ncbi:MULTISPECIES: adenosylcobinamide-GDP ribazoletransferase [Psychrobacter]|uniref:adenosylcobinamide-GDP ribazoletransferase n=1 Tax=Psychrobacter TaxID=497 RepID=UPI00146B8045|nr:MULTISPECIES: adenosylcobinamide-GDP ribazoletransferase [Psychrobacter]
MANSQKSSVGLVATLRHEWRLILIAIQFLTRIPVLSIPNYQPDWLHQSSRHFPAVGLLVGVLCAVVFWLMSLIFTPLVAAIVSTAFGVRLTGAFHEDGLADICDGLGGGYTRERVLTIMKDSRLGTFGVLGLGLAILTKVALLASMPPMIAVVALIIAHGASRLCCISLIALLLYGGDIEHARAKPMAQSLSIKQALVAGSWLVIALLLLMLVFPKTLQSIGIFQWILAAVLAIFATDYWRRLLKRRLGGYTGDGLGATQQISEIAIYAGFAATFALN